MRCQFTLLFLFFFSFIISSSSSNNNDLCFEYILQNECTTVLGEVSINQNEQQDFFDENVSLIVSNVRMFGSNCRRPFLSYYCQLMFGGFFCSSSSSEEQYCLEDQFCVQVSDSCSDDFPLNCSSSLSSPSLSSPSLSSPSLSSPSPLLLSCEEKVTKEIEEVVETPIKVQTCLGNSKEEIECCIGPYVFDDNDECVVQCPQYVYGEKLEKILRIVSAVFIFITIIIYVVLLTPFYMTDNLRYPNNVLFILYAFYVLMTTVFMWAFFDGGPKNFICGDETNFWKVIEHYGNSTRSIVQYSLWILFSTCCSSSFCLFSFNLFCNSTRPYTSLFEKFITPPVDPLIIRLIVAFFFSFSVLMVLGFVLFAYLLHDDSQLLLPLPVFWLPNPTSKRVFFVFQSFFLFTSVMGIVSLLVAIILFLNRGRQIIYFQWRSILVGCFWLTIFVLYLTTMILPVPSGQKIEDYTKCVASHPQTNPTLCSRDYDQPGFLFVTYTLIGSLFTLFLLHSIWTNDLVIGWWKKLFSSLNSNSKYEQLDDGDELSLN